MNTDLDLFIKALCSADDAGALAAVRARAPAIRQAMADHDLALSAQQQACLEQHPEWSGIVYAALLNDLDDLDGEAEGTIEQAIRQARDDEHAEIGEAFRALIGQLEESHYDWLARFRGLPAPDKFDRELLEETGAVEMGGPSARNLLQYGITPAMIYEATRGVYLLFQRVERSLARAGSEGPRERWLHDRTPGMGIALIVQHGAAAQIPDRIMFAEIAGTSHISAEAAEPLYKWMRDVLPIQPFLVERYGYDGGARAFAPLQRLGIAIPGDLVAQWSHRARVDTRFLMN
ncbi:MAG: hypothetical protein V4693_12915 [Pseudomonadota bacterium]